MDIGNTSFFGTLRARLDQLSERQRLISENIANASTPGYRPRDLDTSGFERMLQAQADQSGDGDDPHERHAHGAPGGSAQVSVVTRPDSETTIDGNAVVLEEQMAKAAETRLNFETGIALYQKGLQLIRMAARPPGR